MCSNPGAGQMMTETPRQETRLRTATLNPRHPHDFDLRPDGPQLAALAQDLGLLALRKLRFAGTLAAEGSSDWRLEAELGATVTQPCVVTLEPVSTRIDQPVLRRFLAHMPEPEAGSEIEMPEDDSLEPLGAVIDLEAVMAEALALALPLYPRKGEAELGEAVFAEPGVTPMTDEDTKPFAGLAALKSKLDDKD